MEMTIIGWSGILLSLAAVLNISKRSGDISQIALLLLLVVVQLGTAFYYYQWAQTNTTDATLYYYDPYYMYGKGIGLSTVFVIWCVQSLKTLAGGTYLDYFLLFQATGTWGASYIIRIYGDVFGGLNKRVPFLIYMSLFLPGIHFWTSAIGKDGPLFLAAAMAAWAAVSIRERWITFAIAATIMLLFRPHIALAAMAAFAISIALDARTSSVKKIGLLVVVAVGLGFAAFSVRSTFAVDVTNADSVADFFSSQAENGAEAHAGGSTVLYGSFLMRLFSLLFRPLFFDAEGVLGYVVSFENLFILFALLTILFRIVRIGSLARGSFFIRYNLVFFVLVVALLSLVYYNVGLGLRQKTMMMPALLSLFAVAVAIPRARRIAQPPAISIAGRPST